MDKTAGSLTVFFEGPFWVGILEREEGGKRSICKVTFGAEPKDGEVWGFVLARYGRMKFSPAQPVKETAPIRSPKRAQREIRKAVIPHGMGTKSQQAWKRWQESQKTERKAASRQERAVEKQRLFEQKRQKRKEKHKGR